MFVGKEISEIRGRDGSAQGRSHQPGAAYAVVKRIMDVVGSLAGLVLAVPPLLLCGLWIKLADGGPILYRQWRVGQDGWLFRLYKLRTMTLDAEVKDGAQFASRNDPRVLAGCAWMRKSHFDELPQLWNILLGDMSLVGPRPERPEIVERLRGALPQIDKRLAGRPGLTGLAQVCNGYSNDIAGVRKKLAYDLLYLKRRGLLAELWLMIQTVPKVWDHSAL